jgi:prepilin-type processing-associated H-X9-DG protein
LTTTIHCPHCGQTYELTPEQVPQYAGRTITCTACQQPFAVTIPTATLTSTAYPPHPPPPTYTAYPTGAAAQQRYEPQQSNGFATASLISGILGFCIPVLGGIVAIVLGIVGLTKTKDPRVGGKGMAIAGLVLGGVSIVVTPCFMSILLPSLNRARETANRVKCAQNMKQIGLALLAYGNVNRGAYPPDLQTLLSNSPGLKPEVMTCPSSDDTPAANVSALNAGGHLSYVYLPGHNTSAAATDILLYEPMTSHNDGTNILFGDGHVEFMVRPQAEVLIAANKTKGRSTGYRPPPPPGIERP